MFGSIYLYRDSYFTVYVAFEHVQKTTLLGTSFTLVKTTSKVSGLVT